MEKKNNKKPFGEVLSELVSEIAGRILKNEAKGEAAFYTAVLMLAASSAVLDIVSAIMVGQAWGIVKSLTLGVVLFLFVPLLTVSDRTFLMRGRSMIIIGYSALRIILDATGFIGTSGAGIALAALGFISGIALYGTLIYDQLFESDPPIKYWLVYGGAIYRILYALVRLIIDGVSAASVAGTLAGIFGGMTSVAVLVLLIYLFDRFSFAKYMYFEIIDAGGDEELDEIGEDETAAPGDLADGVGDGAAMTDIGESGESVPHEDSVDIPSDVEYVPYLFDGDDEGGEDNEEELAESALEESALEESAPETSAPEEYESEEIMPEELDSEEIESSDFEPEESVPEDFEPEEYEALELEPEEIGAEEPSDAISGEQEISSEPSDTLAQTAPDENENQNENQTENETENQTENQTDAEIPAEPNVASILEELSPVELKYARFAALHNKPDQTLQVTGMSGDLFDVWVDGDTLCFQNDLEQATEGRGIRTAVIPFGEVSGIGYDQISDGVECVVLTYKKADEAREIRFTKESFANFKRVMEAADGE